MDNVGTIYFSVEADTDKLLTGTKDAQKSVERLGTTLNRTGNVASSASGKLTQTASAARELTTRADTANRAISNMYRTLGGVFTVQGVNALISMAEGYNEMSERVRMATSSQAEFEEVQKRLISTANGTYRSISEASEVFIQSSNTLRAFGYSTEQAMDIVDSMSYSFVKNATSAERAKNAMTAFTNSMNKGRVDANAWNSILAATPSIVEDIAKSMNKTTSEVLAMGAQGKITAAALSEAWRNSLDSNKQAADGMATTVKDAFTNLKNNLTVYLGEANKATGTTAILSKAVLTLGNNIDTVVTALGVVGAGMLARYVAQLGASVVASAKNTLASRAEAVSALNAAKAHASATAATLARAQATTGLAGASSALVAAEKAHAVATSAVVTAQKAATAASLGLTSVLGGPVGIIALVASVAAGFVLMQDKAQAATPTLIELGTSIDEVRNKFLEMSRSQRDAELEKTVLAQKDAYAELQTQVDSLESAMRRSNGTKMFSYNMRRLNAEIVEAIKSGKDVAEVLDEAQAKLKLDDAARRSWSVLGGDIATTQGKINAAGERISVLKTLMGELESSSKGASAGVRELGAALTQTTASGQQAIENVKKQIALYGKAGTAASALYDIQQARIGRGAMAEFTSNELDELEKYYTKLDNMGKVGSRSAGGGASAGSRRADSAAEDAKKLNSLAEALQNVGLSAKALAQINAAKSLSEYATPAQIARAKELAAAQWDAKAALDGHKANVNVLDELSTTLAQAAMNGEQLAQAQAKARLNPFATAEEVALVKDMAAAIYQVEQADRARKNTGTTKAETEKYVFGDSAPLHGGAYDNQLGRYDADKQAEEKRYAEQLKRLKQAQEAENAQRDAYAKAAETLEAAHQQQMQSIRQEYASAQTDTDKELLTTQIDALKSKHSAQMETIKTQLSELQDMRDTYRDIEEQAEKEHSERLAQIAQARYQTMLGTVSSVLGELSGATSKFAGEQSGIYRALFATSKAFSIAQSIVAIQTALAQASANPYPKNLAAMAQVASATAGIVSTIQGTSFSGGRQYGGGVAAGGMYRVNENGAPELLNTANGQQFLIPNRRGEVVSNAKAVTQSGRSRAGAEAGGVHVETNVYVASNGAASSSTTVSGGDTNAQAYKHLGDMVSEMVRGIIAKEYRQGGMFWSTENGR